MTDEKGQGILGLMIKAFDKDRIYDDLLGAEVTDEKGFYKIVYKTQAFREGREPGPDIYVTVTDKDGNIIYTSEETVKLDAGKEEIFDIIIKRIAKGVKPTRKVILKKEKILKAPNLKDINVKGIGPVKLKALSKAGIKDVKKFIDTDDTKLKSILKIKDIRTLKKEMTKLLKKKK